VRAAFLGFAAAEPDRYVIVDATGDETAVLARAVAALDPIADRLPRPGAPSRQPSPQERT